MKKTIIILGIITFVVNQLAAGLLGLKPGNKGIKSRFEAVNTMTAEECYDKAQKHLEVAGDYIYKLEDNVVTEENMEKESSDKKPIEEALSDDDIDLEELLKKNMQDLSEKMQEFYKKENAFFADFYLKKAAEKGLAKAQYEYAVICLKRNSDESRKCAVENLLKAAEQEYALAYKELAECYKNGIGTEVDKKKSKQYQKMYKKAKIND